ncbi:LPXTG cell wall anchor domain-containing protein, partial [Enterococcus durans]
EMKLNQSSENTLPQTGDSKAKLQDSVGEMKLNQSSENTLPQTGDSKAKLQGIVGLVLLFFASLLGLQISQKKSKKW